MSHQSFTETPTDTGSREAARAVVLKVPVRLQTGEKEVCGYTKEITAQGLRMISATALGAGTPLAFQCSFGKACYLNLSGQVTFCNLVGNGPSSRFVIGMRFSGLRDLEQTILVSAIDELKRSAATQEESLLTISVAKDTLALEAASAARQEAETATVEKQPKAALKRGRKFTPNPPWVQEMNDYLEPYRQAIWNCRLVQETSTGELSLRQVHGWSIQFYPFIEYFPHFMAVYLAKAPDPMSRVFLIDNLKVEKRHADQWINMAVAFGIPKEDLFTTPILPEVEALTHWMWSITNRGSFVEAVGATNYAIEGVTQGIAAIMVRGFVKYHGKDGVFLDKKAYSWMEAHSSYDDLHPYEALEVIKQHAPTSELQHKVRHAAQRSLEYLLIALEACYSAYAVEHATDHR